MNLIKLYEEAPRGDKLNYVNNNGYEFKNLDLLRKEIQKLRKGNNDIKKAENNVLVVGDLHCLPLDTTEVLTKKGWVFLKDITNEEIMISDENTNLYFEQPLNKIIKKEEEIYSFKRRDNIIESTSEHRNFLFYGGKRQIKTTKQILDKTVGIISNGNKIDGDKILTKNEAKLVGFMLGDGTKDVSLWKINVKKQRKKDYIENILEGLLTNCPQKGGYTVYRAKSEFTKKIDIYLNKDKTFKMEEILKLDNETLKNILDGIINSDGNRKKDRPNISVSSINLQSLKDIQTICHLVGYNCNIGHIHDNSKSTFPSDKPLYNICISKNIRSNYIGKYSSEVKRTTKVGCLTVSTGLFLAKQGNTIFITGNCPAIKEGYLDFLKAIYKKYKCNNVVFIGDIIDNHYSSFHNSDPNGLGGGDELKLAISKLEPFYKAFPKAKVCLGNHDEILRRKAFANDIPKQWIKEYSDVLNTPNWEFDFEFEIDGVIYNHGMSGGGQRGAIKEAIMRGKSVVRGHFHSQCYIDWYADKSKKIFGMQVGCGVDDSSYAFAYGKYCLNKSIIGCGVVLGGKHGVVELMDI